MKTGNVWTGQDRQCPARPRPVSSTSLPVRLQFRPPAPRATFQHVRVMQQAVEQCRHCGGVSEELAQSSTGDLTPRSSRLVCPGSNALHVERANCASNRDAGNPLERPSCRRGPQSPFSDVPTPRCGPGKHVLSELGQFRQVAASTTATVYASVAFARGHRRSGDRREAGRRVDGP